MSDMFLMRALPEVVLALTTCVVLLVGVLSTCRWASRGMAALGVLLTLVALYIAPGHADLMWATTPLTKVLKASVLFVLLVAAWVLPAANDERLANPACYTVALLSALGAMIMVSARHLILVYVGLELMSLPLYALVATWRDDGFAVEAALKYFITGALASAMLLYGFAWLYASTGHLDFTGLAALGSVAWTAHAYWALLAVGFIVAGLAFKLGVAPFHMWVPDVYQGAPAPVTMLVATLPKLATVGFVTAFMHVWPMPSWSLLWVGIGLISVVWGNVAALAQRQFKRLLAFSSVAHMGYLVLALACMPSARSAVYFYVLTYSVSTALLFFVVVRLERALSNHKLAVDDLQGLQACMPWEAWVLAILMFSMAGIPPLVGFMGKLFVMHQLLLHAFAPVACVAMLASVVGVAYYVRVIKRMHFEPPGETLALQPISGCGHRYLILTLSVLVLVVGLLPGGFLAWLAR